MLEIRPQVRTVSPRDYTWQWPASFTKINLKRLQELGRVTPGMVRGGAARIQRGRSKSERLVHHADVYSRSSRAANDGFSLDGSASQTASTSRTTPGLSRPRLPASSPANAASQAVERRPSAQSLEQPVGFGFEPLVINGKSRDAPRGRSAGGSDARVRRTAATRAAAETALLTLPVSIRLPQFAEQVVDRMRSSSSVM